MIVHSGAGMYQITDEFAQKTGEYKDGIERILKDESAPEALQPYLSLINSLNANGELELYPGSPSIAKAFMRRQDSTHLV